MIQTECVKCDTPIIIEWNENDKEGITYFRCEKCGEYNFVECKPNGQTMNIDALKDVNLSAYNYFIKNIK